LDLSFDITDDDDETFRPSLGSTRPPFQWMLRVKRPEYDDHSPPSSAEVENEWSCTSAPLLAVMACMGQFCLSCYTFVPTYMCSPPSIPLDSAFWLTEHSSCTCSHIGF